MGEPSIPRSLGLKASEWVEVRSQAEILSTLDKNGRLDELPFMPQMLRYCGKRFQVRKRVHKLCCMVTNPSGRRMSDTVVLGDVRCDGQAYGGCEMRCMILWKEAWLKRVERVVTGSPSVQRGDSFNAWLSPDNIDCSEADIWAGTRAPHDDPGASEPVYVCQATQVPHATQPLSRWAIGQYFEDYISGNVRLSQILSRLLFQGYHQFLVESGLGFGSVLRWAFDTFQHFRGRTPYPWHGGRLPRNSRTPSVNLNLQVGELVRIKDCSEILKTVDEEWKNRGMSFHPELVRHCGKTFRVLQRVRKLMNESTGQLMVLKNECLVLDGADCEGNYTNPLNCPRAAYPYWREIWLERVPEEPCSMSAVRAETSSF
jgi:hypothetical protein